MPRWNRIDWFCSECGEYWMTTENCSPFYDLLCDCDCQSKSKSQAIRKCATCHQPLEDGEEICPHVVDRSQAI